MTASGDISSSKTLLLLRHAKSSWDDPGMDDIDRPLNDRGERAARLMAPMVAAWHPQWIGCSMALRTRATLAPLLTTLEVPTQIEISAALYDSNEAAYLRLVRGLSNAIDRALVIGHNPVLEDLTQLLIGSANSIALERLSEKFATGTLVTLQCPINRWSDLAPHSCELVDVVRPRDIAN